MWYIAGIAIACFLFLLIIGKHRKTIADYLLALWLATAGFHLTFYYLFVGGDLYDYPILLGWSAPLPLIYPPLLYFYIYAQCYGRLPKWKWLHIAPVVAAFLYMIPFILLPSEQKIAVFRQSGAGYERFMAILSAGINISGVVYTSLSFLALRRYRRMIADWFSFKENINLYWLQYLLYGLGVLWLIVLSGHDPLIYAGAVAYILFIGYYGIRQEGVFTNPRIKPAIEEAIEETEIEEKSGGAELNPNIADDHENTAIERRKKYEKSGLTPELADNLHQRLQSLMQEQACYREPELSLSDLAEKLDTHPNYLSQVINEKEGKNFYDYVNAMRVEIFIQKAQNPDNKHFTLFALALDCGFNSKTAFNRYFKKVTGMSPSAYLQNVET